MRCPNTIQDLLDANKARGFPAPEISASADWPKTFSINWPSRSITCVYQSDDKCIQIAVNDGNAPVKYTREAGVADEIIEWAFDLDA